MRPYSTDLRERILAAVERGEHSLRQLADLFSVSLSFLVRLLQRYRRTGSALPQPHGGGPTPCLDERAVQRLLDLVHEQPDATLRELRDRLGVPCHISTIARVLRRRRLSRKKKTLHAEERDSPRVQAARADFDDRLGAVDSERLIFVDETGATTNMTRTYGRAPEGERVEGTAPASWESVTLIAGLRSTEVVAPFIIQGATDTPTFQQYVEEVLAPEVRPGDVVVWDNLKPHQNAQAIATLEEAGARVEPLPPHSPDKTPIEEMFSKVKEHLRTVAARTVQTVTVALVEGLQQVTPTDIQGWFQDRCAYAMH
jgi:transposase